MRLQNPYTVVLIVPTGIGASIGGYAGDAMPVARAMAQCCDRLITHPNVLNGAQLYWSAPNIYYVEGYALDKFASATWGLKPTRQNRLGLILDQAIEPDLALRHIQAAEATKTTLGIDLREYVVTDQPLEIELRKATSGASWGTIGNPDSLLRAAEKLITQAKVEAIAIVARFPDDQDSLELQNYRQGSGVDPIAGAEAVISHLVVRTFHIPAAHAPALNTLPLDQMLSPKAAAEELGYTFLPCILVGLSRAPQFITHNLANHPDVITSPQVNAVVIPASACGSGAVLSLSHSNARIIAVEDNQTKMAVYPEPLGIKAIKVKSYLEALGVIVSDQAGVNPQALGSLFSRLHHLL